MQAAWTVHSALQVLGMECVAGLGIPHLKCFHPAAPPLPPPPSVSMLLHLPSLPCPSLPSLRNVPILLQPLADTAAQLGMVESQLRATLAECRSRLHALRSTRPRPSLDNKVVAAWNGMAIGAFAAASRVLAAEQPPCAPEFPVDGCAPGTYLEAAVSAARFVRDRLYDGASGTLLRSYCDGPSPIPAFADDFANLVAGLLDLYECGGGVEWLQWAVQLQGTMDRLFWDETGGGYFSTSGTDPSSESLFPTHPVALLRSHLVTRACAWLEETCVDGLPHQAALRCPCPAVHVSGSPLRLAALSHLLCPAPPLPLAPRQPQFEFKSRTRTMALSPPPRASLPATC